MNLSGCFYLFAYICGRSPEGGRCKARSRDFQFLIFAMDESDTQPSTVARDSVESSQNEEVNGRYWCYMCSKVVSASQVEGQENELENSVEMACSECGDGFIEAVATAQPFTNVHPVRRTGSQSGGGHEGGRLEGVDLAYSQLLQQLLEQNSLNNAESDHGHIETSEEDSQNNSTFPRALEEDGQNLLIHEDDLGQGDDGDSESGSITIRVGPDDWDSMDENDNEEEWEEADEEEEGRAAGREEERLAMNAEEEAQSHPRITRSRDIRRLQQRTGHVERNLRHYLQEIFENLAGNNIEVRVELPEGPLYVGNPGDYLDARGFEQLLQHLAENDNTRRGTPPAAKSAVENLPAVVIDQKHEEDGSSVCAICKDAVSLGEPAKQLPCLHLYHPDCILPWLSTRNSCPICRYELPTDDPDYEEQKGNERRTDNVQNSSQEFSSEQSSHVSFHAQDNTREISSGQSSHTEVENVPAEQNMDVESVSDMPEIPGSPNISESDAETETEGVTDDELELENVTREEHATEQENDYENRAIAAEGNRVAVSRTLGRGWLLLAAGPVLSVVGLVLVLCFGNRSIGGRIQQRVRQLEGHQSDIFRESHIQQIGGSNEVYNRRRWWLPFQR